MVLGKIYPQGGILAYYPTAIALKWPTVLPGMLACRQPRAFRIWRSSRAPSDLFLMPLLFPLVFFLFALNARYNIGERHILPLYPFALLLAGGIWRSHPSQNKGRMGHPAIKAFLIFALCLNAADAPALRSRLLVILQHLPRSPAEQRWRLLTDSNLDRGQGLIALRNYQQQQPNEALHLAWLSAPWSCTLRDSGPPAFWTTTNPRERWS